MSQLSFERLIENAQHQSIQFLLGFGLAQAQLGDLGLQAIQVRHQPTLLYSKYQIVNLRSD
jgi:hypothetical protein